MSDASSEGGCSGGASMKVSTATPESEVEKRLQRCRGPWLYCYPRARAHSSLLACYRAMGGRGGLAPQRLCRDAARDISSLFASPRTATKTDHTQNPTRKEAPLSLRLAQRMYPSCQMPLVSESTVSMVEAVLSHLQLSEGTPVFLPGLLLYPHYHLLELFDAWNLRVLGYDVDYVTMRVEEDEFRKKLRDVGHSSNCNRNSSKKSCISCKECSAIVLFIGVGARFLTNVESIVSIAREDSRVLTLELQPVTAASFWPETCSAGRADVQITCMDAAGEMGGAIAFSKDPLLARGILARLEGRPLAAARRQWVSFARHIAHVMVSDGMSFRLALWVMQWGSLAAQKLRPRRRWPTAEEAQVDETARRAGRGAVARADRIFEFLMASQVKVARGGATSRENDGMSSVGDKKKSNKNNGQINLVVPSRGESPNSAFSQPHRGLLLWMLTTVTSLQRRVDADCFSLWEFLSRLRNDVEVVSAGEPTTPRRCVAGHSDSLLLRVREPEAAARALRTAGFDAVPAVACVWSGCSGAGEARKRLVATLREIVLLPDCPQSAALAQHALFLPLYAEMRWKNREKLHHVMQKTFPASLFCSPSAHFRQHVTSTPSQHAYRSTEVEALLRSCKQTCKDTNALFADSQPLLLWALLGPVPGYLLSKL
ncbi:uncharacterized protein Tco025E_07420 [Trypanosoma conorhini]|uniref:Uncharacterized protein n=1 Tax=Trypanosoma conorhini TaxID=83891 RepID=A0A422NNW7_9TRYP|nr:uncharacterized protein Tco025E_07420 [Trypanosoma conorhini]RNF07200.1 hypothetical protein Tco025E_07420 [Trypanosoma conorhini]